MKKISLVLVSLFMLSAVGNAQFAGLDKSPLDLAWYPHNFAHDRKEGEKAIARVMYSRPAKKDREVMGKMVPYGKVWRVGANEATEIKFYQDVQFGGKKVKAGTYSMFAIPGEKEWTVILSNDVDYWGAYSYNQKNDLVRVTAPVGSLNNAVENFTIQFNKKNEQEGTMRMAWENTVVEVPISH